MAFLENIDRELFLFLNGLNSSWLDPVMKTLSSSWIWLPVVALFIFLCVKYFKKKFWIAVVFGIMCYAITDQGTNLVKKNVKRFRPSHNTEISHEVHILDNYRGGQYGFFSSHAANSFGLAFISLLFVKKKWYTIMVLTWAAFVSYSRIYIGVHYPSDVLVGALFGTATAFALYYLRNRILCCRIDG
jgi:undecaprenyl-diphosphatase